MEIIAKQRDNVLLSGPASISLVYGEANILGASIRVGKKVIVLKEKQLVIEIDKVSSFELRLGEGAEYRIIHTSTIPDSWKETINKIEENGYSSVMIIGGVDSGKSTLCTYLANSFLKIGIKPNLIDADIGQSDLGPPTTIGLGNVSDYITSLSSAKVTRLFFIGHTTPNRVVDKVISGMKKLTNSLEQSNVPIIINTDGWINGPEAKSYKRKVVDELSPDLILGIGEERKFMDILRNVEKKFMHLHSSNYVKKRNREERKSLREYGYGRCFEKASMKHISLNGVKLDEMDKYLEIRDRLVGLIDENGFLLGIGILKELYEGKGEIRVYTSVGSLKEVNRIEMGSIKISESGKELDSGLDYSK